MAKRVLSRKLGRKKDARKMLLRNLVTSLILYERIKTTEVKAKALKPVIEKLISRAKKSDKLRAKRVLNAYLLDKNATKKVFEVLLPEYKNRTGGMVRILKIGERVGDSAKMAIIELILPKALEKPKKKKTEKEIDKKESSAKKEEQEKLKAGVKTKIKKKA